MEHKPTKKQNGQKKAGNQTSFFGKGNFFSPAIQSKSSNSKLKEQASTEDKENILTDTSTTENASATGEDSVQLKTTHSGKSSLESHHHAERKDASARFKDDNSLKGIFNGASKLEHGDNGVKVIKLQQALIDMKYNLPRYGVDGDFGDETLEALKAYQSDSSLPITGKFDKATIEKMNSRFDTRSDYITAAEDFDTNAPFVGTRSLNNHQKDKAVEELEPQPGTPGAQFDPSNASVYSAEIKQQLTSEVGRLYQVLYLDKVALRADPAKNFHKENNLEGAANVGKTVTDKLYGDLNKGPVFKMGANLIDQWKDEEDRNSLLDVSSKKDKAREKVAYLIDANCVAVNSKFNAIPSETEEAKALAPVIESFIDTNAKIQKILDIEKGWEGAQLEGTQYLQLYKDPNAEANRLRLWELFHVSIHEYIHALADQDYFDWADSLGGSKRHTLVEGFCDFFTLNVRAKFPNSSLKPYQQQVEGDFYDATKEVPDIDPGVYSSNAEAERMVGIIGIKNAQLGYFKGETKLMGAV